MSELGSPLNPRLEGEIVVLEPLGPEHAEGLWEAAQAPEIWSWLVNLGRDRELFDHWMRTSLRRRRTARRARSRPARGAAGS